MCDEIFRVAKENIIISLPNCWSQARRSLSKGGGSIWHYGLPPTPPPDRHKWFFNTEDALNFFQQQTVSRPSVEIVELVALENRRPMINRIWRRLKYPSRRRYLNLYPNTVVCVFRKSRNKMRLIVFLFLFYFCKRLLPFRKTRNPTILQKIYCAIKK